LQIVKELPKRDFSETHRINVKTEQKQLAK